MSNRSVTIGLVALFVVGLILAGVGAGGSAALAQEQAAIPPRQSDNERLRELAKPGLRWGVLSEKDLVAPDEREALGLDDIHWTKQHGKVHPDVYKALDKAERITEPWLDVSGHTGTVYVQVQLKHERRGKADSAENRAAVRELQSRVLSHLTAAEFYAVYAFETLPAVLGYTSRIATEKLRTDADVLAVCLDEKPMPRPTGHVASEDLPPPEQGESAPGRCAGVVHPDVYRAVALNGRVFVMIALKLGSAEPGVDSGLGLARSVEGRLLSSLSADQFWVNWRAPIGSTRPPGLMGFVNHSGLERLQNHPLVELVMLDQRLQVDPDSLTRKP
jgi:hypothetical protein